MDKKYEFTGETKEFEGRVLNRIRAIKDFGDIKKGELGGWIEKEDNLSHYSNCWVSDEAKVFELAEINSNAQIYNNAKVFDNARIFEDAQVFDKAKVSDNAKVFGKTKVYGEAIIYGEAKICGDTIIDGKIKIFFN